MQHGMFSVALYFMSLVKTFQGEHDQKPSFYRTLLELLATLLSKTYLSFISLVLRMNF
jgi:recombinational DNA repair protein (RecF pathway)